MHNHPLPPSHPNHLDHPLHPLTPNTRPPPLMGVTPNGSHFFMSHFSTRPAPPPQPPPRPQHPNHHLHPSTPTSNHHLHPYQHYHPTPTQTRPPSAPPDKPNSHSKKCDTKKCDPLSNTSKHPLHPKHPQHPHHPAPCQLPTPKSVTPKNVTPLQTFTIKWWVTLIHFALF